VPQPYGLPQSLWKIRPGSVWRDPKDCWSAAMTKVSAQIVVQGPANDLARTEIHDDREIKPTGILASAQKLDGLRFELGGISFAEC
jgi:hypothetical protein